MKAVHVSQFDTGTGHYRTAIAINVEPIYLEANGLFPNNPRRPALLYHRALPALDPSELEGSLRSLFESNDWNGCWRGIVYEFHHYHSNTHEVLGVCAGTCELELGGPDGTLRVVKEGDILVLPAGTGHRKKLASPDFSVVGAYPHGAQWNLCYGTPDELAHARRTIATVPAPLCDPVFGETRGIHDYWPDCRSVGWRA